MPLGGDLRIEVDDVLVDSSVAWEKDLPPGRYALLSVSDNGIGMTASVRERIFEAFVTAKEQGRGTGLGLATPHGVVKQYSGYVKLASRPDVSKRSRAAPFDSWRSPSS